MGEAKRKRSKFMTADGRLQFPTLDGRVIPLTRIVAMSRDDPRYEMETALLDDGDTVVLNFTGRPISELKRAMRAARWVAGEIGEMQPITEFDRALMERAACMSIEEIVRMVTTKQ